MNSQSIVYIVDDDEAVRRSLCRLVESAGWGTLSFPDGIAFLEACQPHWRGCLLVDLRMPNMTGLEMLDALRMRGSKMPAIMITAFGDVPQAVHALKSGAIDFIQKPFNDNLLLERIGEALELDRQTSVAQAEVEAVERRVDRLTPREREVMLHLVRGLSSKEVGMALGISRKTVDIHRSRIMNKLEVDSVAHLVRLAIVLENEDKVTDLAP